LDQAADQTLQRVFTEFKRHRRGVLVVFVAVLVIAGAYGAFATPIYRVNVVLAPATDKESAGLGALVGQFSGIGSLAGLGLPPSGKRDEAIAVLKSRTFTARFIAEHNLLPELFYRHWDPVAKRWTYSNPERVPTLNNGVDIFDKDVRRVVTNEVSGLVTLTVEWHDRQRAVDWAGQLVHELNEEMRRRAIDEAQHSLDYLNGLAARTSTVELRDAIYRVVESQVKEIMLANIREEYAFRVLDPPMLPDRREQVWPKRLLIMVVAIPLALIVAALYAFVWAPVTRFRELLRNA
jgi:subunit length determinant Wzz-like protein